LEIFLTLLQPFIANKSLLGQDVDSSTPPKQEEPALQNPESSEETFDCSNTLEQNTADLKNEMPVEKIICPGSIEYDELMKKRIREAEAETPDLPKDIPALGPSILEEELPLGPKRPPKLVIEVDETKANAGFQNIMNAARFWKASQIIGTRKSDHLN